jgi:chromosome segregation ATPase
VSAPPEPTPVDLDSTAELPVLDPAVMPADAAKDPADTDRHHAQTWVMPHAVRPPEAIAEQMRGRLEGILEQLQAQLRENEEALAARETRVRELEGKLTEAHATRALAEERAARSARELEEARGATQNELTGLRAEHEQATAASAAQHERLMVAQRSERESLQQRTTALEGELSAARAAAEQRLAALDGELAQLHARLEAAALQLRQSGEERDAARRTQELATQEHQQRAQAREREHAALSRDLHAERERNAALVESLQRVETRRQTFQSVVTDLRHEAGAHEAALARLTQQLAVHEARARQQDEELERRAARVSALEQQLNAAAALAAQQRAQLEAIPAVDPEEHARLQAEYTQLGKTLEMLRGESAAGLNAEQKRAAQLESELAGVRQEMEDWGGVLKAAQQERDEHTRNAAAGATRVRELEQRLAEQLQEARALQADGNAHAARLRELEADLRAAEDTINRLESQLRGRASRAIQAEHSSLEAETGGAGSAAGTALVEPLPEGATRLLICRDDDREVVHVLGRKTSIGRTPDNDLQIDARFISRHHAVILCGPVNTVIEDLNSTNGVQVNGERISRQTLSDGDEVIIGRARYRFAVRRGSDKR